MNARTTAHRAAFAAQLRLNGEDGVYGSPTAGSADRRAVRGQTPFREVAGDGRAQVVRSVDWLFAAADFCGAGREPRDGDTFTVDAVTYRVSSFNGEPCFRPDPAGAFVRVHTREHARDLV